MKALVCIKPIPSTGAYLPLREDGQFDLDGVRFVVNPEDAVALDLAAEHKAVGAIAEIVAVCVGGCEAENILRAALARGADRAIWVEESSELDSQAVALRLEAVVQHEEPELILCGNGQTGARLAGRIGRPLHVGATELRLAEMAGHVVTCATSSHEAKPLPIRAILDAQSKPLERLDLPTLPHGQEVRLVGYRVPPPRPPCCRVADIAELEEALRRMDRFTLPNPRPPTLWLGNETEEASLAMIAGRRGWPLISGVFSVCFEGNALRCQSYVHFGRYIVEVEVSTDRDVILIVPDAVRTTEDRQRIAELHAHEEITVPTVDKTRETDLATARVVVAGGRGLKDTTTFDRLVGGLAAALGGAVAASGGAANAGIAPASLLIGQTGKTVAPDLYVALGISGVDQHIGGMRDAKTIVAINSDPSAPIFAVADYGLVGDLLTLVPEWIAKRK